MSDEPSRREVFRGNLIRVEVWSGRYREIVRHPGVCAVLPFTPAGSVLLVRQYRDAIASPSLEVPAGTRDVAGEDVAECAARELLEETGHRVTGIAPLGSIHTSPGFVDERVELFVADAERATGPEEGVEVVEMSFDDAVAAVETGRITDGKTVVAILLAARRGG